MTEISNTSETKAKALHVYGENVPRLEVARAYLKVELGNIFGTNIQSDNGSIDNSLEELNDSQVTRLLEAVSYTYRMNGTFHKVTDESLDWMDVELPIDAIQLTKVEPHISEIIYSSGIKRNPLAFAALLGDYFADHPDIDDDPRRLNQFRPKPLIQDTRLITSELNDEIEIFDGNHRLVSAALLGAESVRAYAGIPNGKESISMKGDSVFLTLRLQYEKAVSPEEREYIIETCILLAKSSTDGYRAIQEYWVNHGSGGVVREGNAILSRLG